MRARKIVASVLVLLVAALAIGPRVDIDTAIQPPQIPPDIEGYLAQSESRFSDIKAGTEKTIIWANPQQKTVTPVSIVYIHGFSATRQETAPLSNRVAESLGGNLFYTRLAGHGRSDDAMGEATVNAWINDTAAAIAIGEAIGDEVVLIGSSTGASLLTWMAANDHLGADVSALVFLSPNFGPANRASEFLLWPWGKQIAEVAEGRYREWEPLNAQHAQFWTYRYPSAALLPMMGAVKLARNSDLSTVKQPVLVLYSKEDIVVNPAKTEEIFATLGSENKKLAAVHTEHKWGHVLAGDILSPGTTESLSQQIVEFLIPILDAPAE